jgi:hypothetical protein
MVARGISFVQLGLTFFVMMSKGEKKGSSQVSWGEKNWDYTFVENLHCIRKGKH